jgi:hypothetical protein
LWLATYATWSALDQSVSETTSKSSFDPETQPDLQQPKSVFPFEYPTQQTEAVLELSTALKSARRSVSLTGSNSPFVNPPEWPAPLAQAIYPDHRFSKLSPAFAPPMTLKRSPL